MTAAVDGDLEQLRNEVVRLRADLSRITETLQNLATHGADDIASRVKRSKADLQGALSGKTAGISQEIEENPLTAALASFAIGALLGALIGGRR